MHCLMGAIAHFLINSSCSQFFRWQVNTITYEVKAVNDDAVWISILRNVLWDMTFVDNKTWSSHVQRLRRNKVVFKRKAAVLKCLKDVNCKFLCSFEGFSKRMNVRYVAVVTTNHCAAIWHLSQGDVHEVPQLCVTYSFVTVIITLLRI